MSPSAPLRLRRTHRATASSSKARVPWAAPVPEEIANIACQNKPVVYGVLFRAAAETLRTAWLIGKFHGVNAATGPTGSLTAS